MEVGESTAHYYHYVTGYVDLVKQTISEGVY